MFLGDGLATSILDGLADVISRFRHAGSRIEN